MGSVASEQSHGEPNSRERERLRALVNSLDDAALSEEILEAAAAVFGMSA